MNTEEDTARGRLMRGRGMKKYINNKFVFIPCANKRNDVPLREYIPPVCVREKLPSIISRIAAGKLMATWRVFLVKPLLASRR